jgi:general stress protein 26
MKSEISQNPDENIRKLGELIKGIKTAMLTTMDAEGILRSRPMQTLEQDFEGDLWFLTGKSSEKVHAIISEQQVNLAYAEPSSHKYISVTGRGEIIDDKAKATKLWKPIYKAWFPEGLQDPDLTLLRIRVDSAEFWDIKSSTMLQLIGLTKAVLMGQSYKASPGEHEKVSLKH